MRICNISVDIFEFYFRKYIWYWINKKIIKIKFYLLKIKIEIDKMNIMNSILDWLKSIIRAFGAILITFK